MRGLDGGTFLRRITGYDVARVTFALVLLAAAALKAHQVATDPVTRVGLHGPVWFHIAIILLELFFAIWLLSNHYSFLARRAAIGLATTLAAVSLYHLLAGQPECGCFGTLTVHPAWTLSLDCTFIAALWYHRPVALPATAAPGYTRCWPPKPYMSAPVTWTLFSLLLLFAGGLILHWDSGGARIGTAPSTPMLLQPYDWKGKVFPIADKVRLPQGSDITKGTWTIILYNRDCTKCINFLNERSELLSGGAYDITQTAIIDLSLSRQEPAAAIFPHLLRGRPIQDMISLAQIPVEIRLRDGVVSEVISATTPREP